MTSVPLNNKLSDYAKHHHHEHGLNFIFSISVLSGPKGKQTTRNKETSFPIPDSLMNTGLLYNTLLLRTGLRP